MIKRFDEMDSLPTKDKGGISPSIAHVMLSEAKHLTICKLNQPTIQLHLHRKHAATCRLINCEMERFFSRFVPSE